MDTKPLQNQSSHHPEGDQRIIREGTNEGRATESLPIGPQGTLVGDVHSGSDESIETVTGLGKITSARLVPDEIELRFREEKDDRLYYWTKLNHWSPFQAACLLRGLIPGPIRGGVAEAYWDYDPLAPDDAFENYDPAEDYGRDLRKLTILIVANARGAAEVSPLEIVRWAVRTNMISERGELARALIPQDIAAPHEMAASGPGESSGAQGETNERLIRALDEIEVLTRERNALKAKVKDSGKQWALMRERIYASALYLVAHKRESCIAAGGRVVAARLADLIHDQRVYFGFEDADGDGRLPAHNTIREHLERVLSPTEN